MGIVRHFAILAFAFATSSAHAETLSLDYKVLLDEASIPTALQSLRFSRATSERSNLYFFDTRDLKLFGAGLVIRARDVAGGIGEVMVKARPLEVDDLDESWFDVPGLSCDIDATPIKAMPACSIRIPKQPGEILSAVNGIIDLDDLLELDQKYFANDFGGYDVVAPRVRMWGPVVAYRWRVPNTQGWRVLAEHWTLPNGTEFLELSIQGMSTDHTRLATAMRTFIKDRALVSAPSNLNKTAVTLKILTK